MISQISANSNIKILADKDKEKEYRSLWLGDSARPWDKYSREQSRPSYDFGIHRSYSDLEVRPYKPIEIPYKWIDTEEEDTKR